MISPAYGAPVIIAPSVLGSIRDLPVDGNSDAITSTVNISTNNDAGNGDKNGVAEFEFPA